MKNKKIVIAGGSGFIGEEMIKYWGKTNQMYSWIHIEDIFPRKQYHLFYIKDAQSVPTECK